MERRRIAVAGASGLIGSALVRSLTADGHEVVRLVRRAPRGPLELRWDPEKGQVDAAGLAGCDAVVNVAGAGVGDRRAVTERAKGILMERHSADERQAFELLRENARANSRRVVEVAQSVVDGHALLPRDGV